MSGVWQSSGRERYAVTIVAFVLGVVLSIAMPSHAHASKGLEGTPPVSFSASTRDSVRLGEPVRIRIWFSGLFPDSAQVRVRVQLPAGLALMAGDTARVGRARNIRGTWTIDVLPTSSDTFVIAGFSSVDFGRSVVELDWQLPLVANAGRRRLNSQAVREEMVRGVQRYRYGGFYLVPIDSAEVVTQQEISNQGTRPRPIETTQGLDATGALTDTVDVQVVAFVNRSGLVIDARPAKGKTGGERGMATALLTVRTWRFEPARVRGRTVNDWIEVPVRVLPGP